MTRRALFRRQMILPGSIRGNLLGCPTWNHHHLRDTLQRLVAFRARDGRMGASQREFCLLMTARIEGGWPEAFLRVAHLALVVIRSRRKLGSVRVRMAIHANQPPRHIERVLALWLVALDTVE
jgi:hypothetical protein